MKLVQIDEMTFVNPEHIMYISRVTSGGNRFNLTLSDGKKVSSPSFPTLEAAWEWVSELQSTAKWKAEPSKD